MSVYILPAILFGPTQAAAQRGKSAASSDGGESPQYTIFTPQYNLIARTIELVMVVSAQLLQQDFETAAALMQVFSACLLVAVIEKLQPCIGKAQGREMNVPWVNIATSALAQLSAVSAAVALFAIVATKSEALFVMWALAIICIVALAVRRARALEGIGFENHDDVYAAIELSSTNPDADYHLMQ